LSLSGRGRKNNPFVVARQPPQCRDRKREGFSNTMAGLHCGFAVVLDGAKNVGLALSEVNA
jgi:hypothetical protein